MAPSTAYAQTTADQTTPDQTNPDQQQPPKKPKMYSMPSARAAITWAQQATAAAFR